MLMKLVTGSTKFGPLHTTQKGECIPNVISAKKNILTKN